MTDVEMKIKLQAELKASRYIHSLGVMDEAVALAKLYGVDKTKAELAGLLHDCAKGYTFDEAIAYADKYGIVLDCDTLKCPPVIHAPIGALVAEHEYGITDTEVLSAISNHTVAGRSMTPLDKIIYIADMTEPNRDFDGVDELRRLSRENLDIAYKFAIKSSLLHTIRQNGYMHPMTVFAWNEIKEENK